MGYFLTETLPSAVAVVVVVVALGPGKQRPVVDGIVFIDVFGIHFKKFNLLHSF